MNSIATPVILIKHGLEQFTLFHKLRSRSLRVKCPNTCYIHIIWVSLNEENLTQLIKIAHFFITQ